MSKAAVGEFMSASPLIYFKPTKAFFDFFRQPEWRWREYHDCGAGAGLLTSEMCRKGFDCTGYDLYPRKKSLAPVEKFNTSNIADRMDLGAVALLARPCHSEGLIDTTIHSALEVGEAFYIGKPDKLGPDLVQFMYDVLVRDVGQDGEVLVRVRCDLDKHLIHRKIENPSLPGKEEWWWYQPITQRYTSEPRGLAGFNASDGHVKVLDEKYWANDLQIIETKASTCVENSPHGWIAPDGEWFGCDYAQHDYIARAVLGCSVKRLEKLRFCRCHGDEERMIWGIGNSEDFRARPSPQQKKTLKAKGFDPKF